MALLEKFLFVADSTLPDAGQGLFTRVQIKKGQRLAEYKGKIRPWREVKGEDGYNEYLLKINRSQAIDAKKHLHVVARYANDARGLVRVKGLMNNAEYVIEGKRCFLEATRSIPAGSEVFVYYGKEFWQLIRKIRKEKKKLEAGQLRTKRRNKKKSGDD